MLASVYLRAYYRITDSAVLCINLGHAVASGTGLKSPKGSKTGHNSRKNSPRYFLVTKYPILRILYFWKAGENKIFPFHTYFFSLLIISNCYSSLFCFQHLQNVKNALNQLQRCWGLQEKKQTFNLIILRGQKAWLAKLLKRQLKIHILLTKCKHFDWLILVTGPLTA